MTSTVLSHLKKTKSFILSHDSMPSSSEEDEENYLISLWYFLKHSVGAFVRFVNNRQHRATLHWDQMNVVCLLTFLCIHITQLLLLWTGDKTSRPQNAHTDGWTGRSYDRLHTQTEGLLTR